MLDKILTENFRRLVEYTIKDIHNEQDRRDEEEFAKDELRIKEDLLDSVETYPSNVILDDDFIVAAVDGSGSDNLVTLDDIRVHIVSTATSILYTNTNEGSLFEPIDGKRIENQLGEQPNLDLHWHSGVRGDAKQKLSESLANIYPQKDIAELILPFFMDFKPDDIESLQDIGKSSRYSHYVSELKNMSSLITRAQILTNPIVHEELRSVSEYAAARRVLTSEISPKYLLLDGAMSVFMHFVRQYPSMPSGFMLRELSKLARENGVVLCAVSKNHTIPFAHRIAGMAKEKFGETAKWFCQLPCSEDPGGGLHIYEDRTYIPPKLAVPYLYSFSGDNRPSRIDFDRIWWLENIFVKGNLKATRENEKLIFRDLEFMSRDARWYGYPVPLALAHQSCKLGYEDLRIAREITGDILKQTTEPLRTDFNL
jgi:hypothetical protein